MRKTYLAMIINRVILILTNDRKECIDIDNGTTLYQTTFFNFLKYYGHYDKHKEDRFFQEAYA